MKEYGAYINGEWKLNLKSREYVLKSPIDSKEIASIKLGEKEDIEEAIDSAYNAFYNSPLWKDISVYERAELLNKVANLLEEKVDEIAKIETLNTGKIFREAVEDVLNSAKIFRYYGGIAGSIGGNTYNLEKDVHAMTIREPIGVCAVIVPWNYPLSIAVNAIAPALVSGNTVIVKPPSIAPLSIIKLFEIFDEVKLPKGVVNLILESGSKIGDILGETSKIDKIVFTGSTETGKNLMKQSSNTLKKLSLELGGKSPLIVFNDCDQELALDYAILGGLLNQGQLCVASSRILVQSSIIDEFIDKLKLKLRNIRIGNPFLEEIQMGPLISKEHADTVIDYIKSADSDGAQIIYGGNRLEGDRYNSACYVEPTLILIDNPNHELVKNEIFGPVIIIQAFEDEKEAIKLANCTKYGLAAGVFTKDISRALRISKDIISGQIWINTYLQSYLDIPVEPQKESGQGVLMGLEGLKAFTKIKTVVLNLCPKKTGWID